MAPLVTIKHNFETAHRLPHIGGKCKNLHGHSWWATITVGSIITPHADFYEQGILVEFGELKKWIRTWIDDHLDHGAMLGVEDPLTKLLQDEGSKVFVFGEDYSTFKWPTVEAVAQLIKTTSTQIAKRIDPSLTCLEVHIQETHVNGASA